VHIILILIYDTFVITNTLYYTDIQVLFTWCRMRYNGRCVANVPLVRYVALYFSVL